MSPAFDETLERAVNEAARQRAYRAERFVWHRSQSLLRLVFEIVKPDLAPKGNDGQPFEMSICRLGVDNEDDLSDALDEFADVVGVALTEISVTDEAYLSPQQHASLYGQTIN